MTGIYRAPVRGQAPPRVYVYLARQTGTTGYRRVESWELVVAVIRERPLGAALLPLLPQLRLRFRSYLCIGVANGLKHYADPLSLQVGDLAVQGDRLSVDLTDHRLRHATNVGDDRGMVKSVRSEACSVGPTGAMSRQSCRLTNQVSLVEGFHERFYLVLHVADQVIRDLFAAVVESSLITV